MDPGLRLLQVGQACAAGGVTSWQMCAAVKCWLGPGASLLMTEAGGQAAEAASAAELQAGTAMVGRNIMMPRE